MNRAQRRAAAKDKSFDNFRNAMPSSPMEYQIRLAMAERRGDQKGFSDGIDGGVRLAMGIMLLALLDKNKINRDDVQESWENVVYLSDSVKRGFLSAQDIFDTLLNEYEVKV